MNDLELSIVIVNWNTREILRDCLRSVRWATRGLRAEVLVVDNASSDGSAAMVREEFPECVLVCNATNVGFAAANNQALRIARGRWLLLLNSDTVVLGDVLARSIRYLESHPDVGVMGCRVLNPDLSLQPTCFRYPSFTNLALLTSGLARVEWPRTLGRYQMRGWKRDDERDVEVVTGCYMLVRRAAYEQVGGLDESFFFCGEETDWCRRFARAGWKLRFAPVGEIIHIGNASGRRLDARRDVLLTTGLVRLHFKHGGALAGRAAWLLLWCFNATRWLAWSGASWFKPSAATRREHFRNVLARFGEVWPSASKRAA